MPPPGGALLCGDLRIGCGARNESTSRLPMLSGHRTRTPPRNHPTDTKANPGGSQEGLSSQGRRLDDPTRGMPAYTTQLRSNPATGCWELQQHMQGDGWTTWHGEQLVLPPDQGAALGSRPAAASQCGANAGHELDCANPRPKLTCLEMHFFLYMRVHGRNRECRIPDSFLQCIRRHSQMACTCDFGLRNAPEPLQKVAHSYRRL